MNKQIIPYMLCSFAILSFLKYNYKATFEVIETHSKMLTY